MSRLDPIFAEHERALAPGLPDPQAAVRDRVLYCSADRDATARPRGFPGSSMDVTRPGELDVSMADTSTAEQGARTTLDDDDLMDSGMDMAGFSL